MGFLLKERICSTTVIYERICCKGGGGRKLFSLRIDPYNPIALRMAKTLWSFGCSECNRIKKGGMGGAKEKMVDFLPSVVVFLLILVLTVFLL